MKISIHFRSERLTVASRGPYEIDPEEFEKLKKDFLSFVEQGTPKGGSYRCRAVLLEDRPTELLLKFDEIVYIG